MSVEQCTGCYICNKWTLLHTSCFTLIENTVQQDVFVAQTLNFSPTLIIEGA